MHQPAKEPNDLERFFVERANAGDLEGHVALYEPNATLACGDKEVMVGLDQIRKFFEKFLIVFSNYLIIAHMSKYHSNRGYFGRQIPYTLHWYQSRGYFGRGNHG